MEMCVEIHTEAILIKNTFILKSRAELNWVKIALDYEEKNVLQNLL